MSINYFVHGEMPEGVEWMRKALMMPIPYRSYMAKDLYPNIALLYKQNMPLPDVRNLVREAVRGMTEAAEAEPLNYGFWIGLADMMQPIASLDADYINQGLRALDRAAALSPKRQATEYVRAKLLNLKGDRKGALQAMADAVALDPEVGDAHFFYGLLLLESGDRARGAEELMRASALGREPKSAEEASALGAQLGDLGAYKESIVYFSKALLMKPGDLELTMKLGLVYYFDGQKDPARRLIGEVMKKDDLSRSPQYSSLLPILRDLGLEK
jgi:tetratricopeptide (TPR) repeat protein